MMTDKQLIEKYGQPGPQNLMTIALPFPMRLAWDPHVTINRIQCHRLIAPNLVAALQDIVDHYGLVKIQELHIDYYGGCYNYRLMRGSKTRWSRHAWGTAIDLDPERNLLKENHTTARFARPEYKPMIDIFYKHGFKGLGPEEDRDWMHFEIAY